MKYNNELKVIDTEEKAYLLGFLYGDGTISTYKEKTGRIRFLTKISISKNDEDLMIKLHKHFKFLNLNEFDYSKYNVNSTKQVSLAKSSKLLYDDLMLNGLYPRKSYENKDKLHLPKLPDELMSHFIRGFFDADGSVYIPSKRKNLISIEFCSVAKDFINEINNLFKLINIDIWKIREKKDKNIDNRQVAYIIIINKTSEVHKLIDYMYNGATIYLDRKAKKCLEHKIVNKVLDRNIICSNCNSVKVWNNGKRNKSIRYICQDCGKGFSIKTI